MPPAIPPRHPLVFGHRGASEDEPEHTLKAYRRAIELGVDGVECDVRLTADRHLVCVHDRRVDRTSNGRGVVAGLELAHLEGLDWGSWKAGPSGGAAEQPDRDRKRLLTLNSLLTTVTAVERPLITLVETKHPSRYSGLVERAVASSLRRFGFTEPGGLGPGGHQVRMMSFSFLALIRMRALMPRVPLVYLVDKAPAWVFEGALPLTVDVLGISVGMLRRSRGALVERLHDQGRQAYVWTVDEPADVHRCLDLGVDGIITNRPGLVLDQMATAGYSA